MFCQGTVTGNYCLELVKLVHRWRENNLIRDTKRNKKNGQRTSNQHLI